MVVGKWFHVPVCKECGGNMTDHIKMYSNGICPFCGHDSNSTICDTQNLIIRKINPHPWWKFWAEVYYEGKDDFTKNWMKENKKTQ